MTVKEIIHNATDRLHIEQLTPMQHKMAGLSAKEKAVALIAPTGSGKTLAFALAMLPRISGGSGKVEGLVIAPTRELTLQIAKVLNAVAPALRVAALYGGHKRTGRNALSGGRDARRRCRYSRPHTRPSQPRTP